MRAALPVEFTELCSRLPLILDRLARSKDWYVSASFERRASRSLTANFRQTQADSKTSSGVVLRIYDGYSLHEHALDLALASQLEEAADRFADRVSRIAHDPALTRRPYAGAPWSERLKVELDSEIRSQIPASVKSDTHVHFGCRLELDPRSVPIEERVAHLKTLLHAIRDEAKAQGLADAELTYAMVGENVLEEVFGYFDRDVRMTQTLVRTSTTLRLLSREDSVYSRVGGLGGLESLSGLNAEITRLVHDLIDLRSADRLEPGKYDVLFGPVLSGVIAHEAFGHAQEADTCARGRSKAWELHQSGERVGNEFATILNNPAAFQNGTSESGAWGSYFFDEEGWLASQQVILDKGYLKPPMTNLTSALRLGVPRTANGRRESWASGVYSRQTNTYFAPGSSTLPELMSDLGDGFLAEEASGGMEDPKGMGIQVGIAYLREVKNGKLTGKVFKGPSGGSANLTGYVPEVLNSITGASKIEHLSTAPDTAKHPMNDVGGCGKYHKEFINAGCGGTYLLMKGVAIG